MELHRPSFGEPRRMAGAVCILLLGGIVGSCSSPEPKVILNIVQADSLAQAKELAEQSRGLIVVEFLSPT